MPSQITHLAIARRYLSKNAAQFSSESDQKRFLDGNILPDLAANKEKSHYGDRREVQNLVKRNLEKVNPQKFLTAHHDLDDPLVLGEYLHLYVDYQYYNVFLRDYFARVSFDQSCIDMFETAQRDYQHLVEKYHASYDDTNYARELIKINDDWAKEHHSLFGYGYRYEIPYSLAELDAFIEKMSEKLFF